MNVFEQRKHNMARVFELASKGLDTSKAIAKEVGMRQDTVQKYLAEMDKSGEMFRATISTRETYWFTTQQAAVQCMERLKDNKTSPLVNIVVKTATKFEAGAQIVIPKGVKVQKCPGYRGDRFAHTGKVEGGFASLGPGKYLESDEAMLRRIARKGA